MIDGRTWTAGEEVLAPFLSARGRAARMPEGIRVWGERAARAGALDATMGVITPPVSTPDAPIASLPEIREAFAAWHAAEVFPYAPVAGLRSFREAWRGWIAIKAAGGDPAAGRPLAERLPLPVVTAGVTGALCAAGHLLLDPGDPILVPDRRWDGYDTTFATVLGAAVLPVRLLRRGALDLAAWEAALGAAARERGRVVCVVNFPHNPTGYAPTEAEAEAFATIAADAAERTGASVVVFCDDAYEGFVYTDRPRWSLFYRLVDRHPGLLPVKCDGITKELLFWGGRVGAATAAVPGDGSRPAAEAVWENKLSAVVRGMISSASTPVQALAARVLADPQRLIEARRPVLESLAARRSAFARALETDRARAALDPDPFHGGLFALLNLRRGGAVAAAEALLARGIGVVPFSDPSIGLEAIRVTYATVPADLVEELVEAVVDVASG